MSISEQVKELRYKADIFEKSGCTVDGIVKAFRESADTIEAISAKLQTANMERSAEDCGGGWIYCGDGENLPKEPFACIVTVIDTEPMTMTDFEAILPYQVGYSGGTWNVPDGRQIPFDVIAWMKVPTEPYRGAKGIERIWENESNS